MWLTNHLSVLIACLAHASYTLECEQNQSGQSMSFFKTNGDLSLTGFFDVYNEKCSGPTSTGIHSMEMVATVVQILNSIHYIPGITLGLTLYEVCSYRSTDLQKALISFVVDQDCNNSTIPIAIYTTEDIRAKIVASPSIGLEVPITTVGPIIDVDIHAESAVKFLTVNNVKVVDVLVAQDLDVAQRFENISKVNGLCLNRTILAQDFGNLNDSTIVIIMAKKNVINLVLESSSSGHVSHFIIIPLDGPLPPRPDFEYGSYVFQAYGSCPFANRTDVAAANGSDAVGPAGAATAEQAVSAQFVQTAADVLRIVDAYNDGAAADAEECGGAGDHPTSTPAASETTTTTTTTGCATGNRSAAARASPVGYGAGAMAAVLDRLMLLDGGEYNVTLVHVSEYGGGGGGGGGAAVGSYVQDSNGERRLWLHGDAPRLDRCVETADARCPACAPPPEDRDDDDDDAAGQQPWVTWKENVWIASTLTVAAVGALCAACIVAFILVRVCKKDVMEGNPTFSFVLAAGTLLMYAAAVPYAVDGTRWPRAVCYAKLAGTCASCAIAFSAMLSRSVMIAACDCDSSFMSHVNGYLQTSMCAFAMCVQLALLVQFAAVHALLPGSDLCRVFVDSRLFLGALSYDALLLALLCAVAPYVFRSKRNYREGACFAVAAYLALAVWLSWCAAYALLPRRWSDMCVMVGLTGTATVIVVTVFIPRTYMMMFGIVREQITSSLPSLGYGHTASVTDVNYRSTQALYDSVHVAGPVKCGVYGGGGGGGGQTSTFKVGQSNPNYYSPAGSQIHSIPRSRPLTPVNEYDTPPSIDNRITRF